MNFTAIRERDRAEDPATGLTNHQTKQQAPQASTIGRTKTRPRTPREQPPAGRPSGMESMDPGVWSIFEMRKFGKWTGSIARLLGSGFGVNDCMHGNCKKALWFTVSISHYAG